MVAGGVRNVYGGDKGDIWREVRGGGRKGSDRRQGVEYKWQQEERVVRKGGKWFKVREGPTS
jgi:hypothetical protein